MKPDLPVLSPPRFLRSAGYSALATGALLLVPLVAMRFTAAVRWTVTDFALAAVLLFGTGLALALVLQATRNATLRMAFGVALASALVLAWADLAVGLLGAPGHPANLMHAGVLAIGIAGAALARLRARGMARAMAATALAMGLAGVAGLAAGTGDPPGRILAAHGVFAALFLVSAWLFRRAASRATADHGPIAG